MFTRIPVFNKTKVYIGSLGNARDVQKAVKIIKNGGVVAAQMRNVFGIWIKGNDVKAINKVHSIKESDPNKPISWMMLSKDFLKYIDKKLVHKDLVDIIKDSEKFSQRIGAICHIRAPIKSSTVGNIPSSLLSTEDGKYYAHNLDPFGHKGITNFISKLNKAGVIFVGVTTLNKSGCPEICKIKDAVKYCRKKQISMLLTDPQNTKKSVLGSFTIIDIEKKSVLREGNIPAQVIEKILGVDFNKLNTKSSKFPLSNFTPIIKLDLSPEELRIEILNYISEDKNI